MGTFWFSVKPRCVLLTRGHAEDARGLGERKTRMSPFPTAVTPRRRSEARGCTARPLRLCGILQHHASPERFEGGLDLLHARGVIRVHQPADGALGDPDPLGQGDVRDPL